MHRTLLLLFCAPLWAMTGGLVQPVEPSLQTHVIGLTSAPPGAVHDPEGSSLGIAFPGDSLRLSVILTARDDERLAAEKSASILLDKQMWRRLRVRFEPIEAAAFPGATPVGKGK